MKGSFVFAAYATLMIGIAAASAIATELVGGQLPARGAREMPARIIPVPDTVSPQLQKIIAAPINPNWRDFPKTGAEWRTQVDAAAAAAVKALPALRSQLHVKTEPVTIDGVRAFVVTPDEIPPQNRNRLLIHVHGGCYVSNPGEAGTGEAVVMAGFGHFKVLSVDYRMPPEAPYPAALDDAMTVWKAALKMTPPANMAIFGSSAGGALTLSMILRAKQEGLPLPAAIAPGTPMSDLTGRGDSFETNALLDNVLIAYGASCDARAALYADGHDLKDPLLSPVYGDMHGFPPAILTTGTRDLLLSNTVRVHRKLREAGVEAVLQVFEGMAHAQYARDPTAPESHEAFEEIAGFFDRHLGK
jgi:monoterpene epsilon-lactone hydrolase